MAEATFECAPLEVAVPLVLVVEVEAGVGAGVGVGETLAVV